MPPSPLGALAVSFGLALSLAAATPATAAPTTAAITAPTTAPIKVPINAPASGVAPAQPEVDRVLALSVDGLNPDALRRVGRDGAPTLWRLVDEGAHTLNARTAVELTDTLPNHTSMVTGRRIAASARGHGVTWNDDRSEPRTVQEAAGHGVGSVFSRVHAGGGSTALFSTKTKLSLFARSWTDGIDRTTIRPERDGRLSKAVRRDLVRHGRELTFVHLGAVDVAGHAHGFMSAEYLDAVRRVDGLVGRLVRAIEAHDDLAGTVVVLTADHGGRGASHGNPSRRANYTVPFTVWGPGVRAGGLYARNPSYDAPGRRGVGYGADEQPIRNGDLANLALDLLGLGSVPGSTIGADQELLVG